MKRVLEPEIMNDKNQVAAYAKADFSDSNKIYIENIISEFGDKLKNALDVGCGPGDLPIMLGKRIKIARITAVDGSKEMIKFAEENVKKYGLEKQIKLEIGYVPGLKLKEHGYDIVISKDTLHHIPNPLVFWKEIYRLIKPGGAVYVMDLLRPKTPKDARRIVETVAGKEDSILKEDFYNSLCAAFTPQEIKEQLKKVRLDLNVKRVSERHMVIKGIL